MEDGIADEGMDYQKKLENQLEIISLHLGTNLGVMLEYLPQPMVMDTV